MTMKEAIAHVVEGHNLAPPEAAAVMDEIMNGQATPGADRRVPCRFAHERGNP